MKKLLLLPTIIFFAACSTGFSQIGKDLNVKYMLRGYIYAKSSIPDTNALGGFGGSRNTAKKISDSTLFLDTGVILKIDTSKIIIVDSVYTGYHFYIVNKCDTTTVLRASDSRLYVIAEAFIANKWQEIEYLPSSFCGNSYHNLYLLKNEFWEFGVPKYSGKIATKIRYKLKLKNGTFLYSNEMNCKINKEQLSVKQGYNAVDIMDPYND